VNGEYVTEEYVIKDEDEIEIKEMLVVSDFIEWFEISLDGFDMTVNGISVRRSQVLKHGDIIEVTKMEMEKVAVLKIENSADDVVISNDEPLVTEVTEATVEVLKKYVFNFTINNKSETVITEKKNMVFVDIFDYIDFDLTVPKGIIQLKHNGEKANYTALLRDNDVIEIYWK